MKHTFNDEFVEASEEFEIDSNIKMISQVKTGYRNPSTLSTSESIMVSLALSKPDIVNKNRIDSSVDEQLKRLDDSQRKAIVFFKSGITDIINMDSKEINETFTSLGLNSEDEITKIKNLFSESASKFNKH